MNITCGISLNRRDRKKNNNHDMKQNIKDDVVLHQIYTLWRNICLFYAVGVYIFILTVCTRYEILQIYDEKILTPNEGCILRPYFFHTYCVECFFLSGGQHFLLFYGFIYVRYDFTIKDIPITIIDVTKKRCTRCRETTRNKRKS